jgi:hypothetical protein
VGKLMISPWILGSMNIFRDTFFMGLASVSWLPKFGLKGQTYRFHTFFFVHFQTSQRDQSMNMPELFHN